MCRSAMLMRMRSQSGLLALCVLALGATSSSCSGGSDRAPYGPSDGRNGVVVVAGGSDASKPGDDDDGGEAAADAGEDAGTSFYSCERIPGVRGTGAEDMPQVTLTTEPADFIVVRQALRWNSDCQKPTLTIELSDGICPAGFGHQLEITLSANAIEDGMIRLGENRIAGEADSPEIKVRYTRPTGLKPTGTWGTCDGAQGMLFFSEAPELTALSKLEASYQFMLTPCDDSTTDTMNVFGIVNIQQRYALSEVCPDRVR